MDSIADFRSDTMTRPTDAMRQAMARAEVGDDVFGEDPTMNLLEAEAAAFLGQEAAVFVPSGTMANQVAVHVHCRPGDELLCEEHSHVYDGEAGSVAALSGTQIRPLRTSSGFPEPADLESLVRGEDPHHPRTRLLVLENTSNLTGGRVLEPKRMSALLVEAKRLGLLVHVDGARLVNAAVAAGCSPAELARGVDSVSLCFSKGLGAPVGSVLAGDLAFVLQARRVRKALGGGMRQAGVLAAAARIALRDGPALIPEDHRRARTLAKALGERPGLRLAAPCESNILLFDLEVGDAQGLLAALSGRGVRALAFGPRLLRLVTHRDVNDEHVTRCIEAVSSWAAQYSPTRETRA